MARGYAGPEDPDKGKPYRHTRAKIDLMLTEPDLPTYGQLLEIITWLADQRPVDVLNAIVGIMGAERAVETRQGKDV